jgi:hypothetical protein
MLNSPASLEPEDVAWTRCHLALEQPKGEDGDQGDMGAAPVQVAVVAASWS